MKKMNNKIVSLGKNYIPGSISSGQGFLGIQARMSTKPQMFFSMKKAKQIVKQYTKKSIDSIKAGLDGDFRENSCTIFDEDGWHEYDVYEHSNWATPIIIINFIDKPNQTFECYIEDSEKI